MSIRELSFVSQVPLTQLPYLRHQLRLQQAVEPTDLAATLGKLAKVLKRQYQYQWPIVCDPANVALVSPIPLPTGNEFFTVIAHEPIDLVESAERGFLLQVCNFALYRAFKKAASHPQINYLRQRIYSKITPISKEIEARRYLTFNFLQDESQHLILLLDFANEYRSSSTLDRFDLKELKVGEKLIDTYQGRSCEFLGVGEETIGTSFPKIGNKSLIEYHQQRNHISGKLIEFLEPSTPVVKVRYHQPGKRPFEAEHIPHLLKKVYNRTDRDCSIFERQLWSIEKKVEIGQETIRYLNNKNKFFLDFYNEKFLPVYFSDRLRKPTNLQICKSQKLNFGKVTVTYPSAGLRQGELLEKPEEIKAVILSPQNWQKLVINYIDYLKQEFNRFGIELKRHLQFYNPVQALEINQLCQSLRDCDCVIAFVPESQHPDYNLEVNPYKRIKKQLLHRKIPSQMINYETLQRKEWDRNIGYNLVLGINAKLGNINWQLTDLPGTAQAWIGLDISRKNNRTVGASAFLLNCQGRLIGWSTQELTAYQETFDPEALRNFLLDVVSLYQSEYQQPLQHLVIHRDGELQNLEYESLIELKSHLKSAGLEQLDVVEIIKSGTCRAVEIGEEGSYQNPDKGYAWEHCANEAIVLTTGKREAKVSTNSSPRPLRIRRRLGETDLITLAQQVYWLSEMQVGSTQTIRLPITTYYADRAAQWLLEGLLPAEFHRDRRLWFL